MSDYRIRRVDPNDEEMADLLRDMHVLCFGDTAPQPDYDEPTALWWMVYRGHEPAAFAALRSGRTSPDKAYLYRVGVLCAHTGQGLQRRLIHTRERKARTLGYTGLVTDTSVDNIKSANNLLATGFRLYTPRSLYAGANWLYWRKDFDV